MFTLLDIPQSLVIRCDTFIVNTHCFHDCYKGMNLLMNT